MVRHRKLRKVFDQDGDAHFLTFSCYHRLPLLNRDRTREWTVAAIERSRTKNPFDLWAWVIMPEHVHLVLLPQPEARIASSLASLKLFVARRAIAWLKEHAAGYLTHLEDSSNDGKRRFRFWQRGGGYDRNLRSTRDVHEKIAYVHHNPVKRGLVAQPEQWRWSSARAWASGSDEPLRLDRRSVPILTSNEDSGRSGLLD
ncbi:MAG: hypothetical protein Fues2KO_40340 [Fuerstiella sp.]